MLCAVLLQFLRDDPDQRGIGDHTDLDRIWEDVRKYCIQLRSQEFRRGFQYAGHAGGILRRQGRDGGHGVNTVGRHGFHVRLNARAAAGIAPRDG